MAKRAKWIEMNPDIASREEARREALGFAVRNLMEWLAGEAGEEDEPEGYRRQAERILWLDTDDYEKPWTPDAPQPEQRT